MGSRYEACSYQECKSKRFGRLPGHLQRMRFEFATFFFVDAGGGVASSTSTDQQTSRLLFSLFHAFLELFPGLFLPGCFFNFSRAFSGSAFPISLFQLFGAFLLIFGCSNQSVVTILLIMKRNETKWKNGVLQRVRELSDGMSP